MFYVVGPSAAKTVKFTNNLNLGGITCQQEVFIGPDDTHKLSSAPIVNVVLDGTSRDFLVPINTPSTPGVDKIFVVINYLGQPLMTFVGINGVLVATGTITDPGLV